LRGTGSAKDLLAARAADGLAHEVIGDHERVLASRTVDLQCHCDLLVGHSGCGRNPAHSATLPGSAGTSSFIVAIILRIHDGLASVAPDEAESS
jgi:hypothetical protein